MATSRSSAKTQCSQLELAFLPRRACAGSMRAALRAFLVEHAVEPLVLRDVVLAADEAFINAIVHAGGQGVIVVSAAIDDGETRVEVRDLGQGFDLATLDVDHMPDRDRAHGRGLFLIRRMMDSVEISSGDGGTTVQMTRRTA